MQSPETIHKESGKEQGKPLASLKEERPSPKDGTSKADNQGLMGTVRGDYWALAESIMAFRNSSQHSVRHLINHVSAPALPFASKQSPGKIFLSSNTLFGSGNSSA